MKTQPAQSHAVFAETDRRRRSIEFTTNRASPQSLRDTDAEFVLAHLNCRSLFEALDCLGIRAFLVDEKSMILLSNRAAEEISTTTSNFQKVHGALSIGSPFETARLHALVATCARDGRAAVADRSFRPKSGGTSIASPLFQIVPLRQQAGFRTFAPVLPVAIVIVGNVDCGVPSTTTELRARFGLTAAEAVLAGEIVRGDGVRAVANRLNISVGTARTHLSHIFDKTGTRRQAELVSLLLRGQ